MNKEEYYELKKYGMLWEFHPECTGDWEKDKNVIPGCRDDNMEQRESIR